MNYLPRRDFPFIPDIVRLGDESEPFLSEYLAPSTKISERSVRMPSREIFEQLVIQAHCAPNMVIPITSALPLHA
ncbi:hypothetical protein VTI28DRAFT_7437 [Corynascus sepedonium]